MHSISNGLPKTSGLAGRLNDWAQRLRQPHRFRQNLLIVLGIAIAVRIVILLVFWSDWIWQNGVVHDNWDLLAINLLDSSTFGFEPGEPTIIRAPLFPLFEIPLYFLFGQNYLLWSLALCLFDVLGCGLLVVLGRKLWGERAALLAGLFWAVQLPLTYYAVRIEQFVIALPLVFLWLYFYCRLDREPEKKALAWALGLVCGLLILNKSVYLPAPVLAAGMLLFSGRGRTALTTRLSNAGIVLLVSVVLVAPWTYRNYQVTGGRLIPVQSLFAYQFFLDVHWDELDAAEGTERPPMRHWQEVYKRQVAFLAENQSEAGRLTGVEQELREEDICREQLLPWIKNNPAVLLSKTLKNGWQFWFGAENANKTRLFLLMQSVYLVLTVIAIFMLLKHRKLAALGSGLLLILALWAEHALVYAMGRHSLDLVPILAMLTGLGLDTWLTQRAGQNRQMQTLQFTGRETDEQTHSILSH